MNGIINVYKEKGYTSHDVVARLRGILHQKKIGHTGTLDPEAEGVLPVCVGNATKVCDLLTDKRKEYEAVLLLGITTDTQDMTGRVLEEKEAEADEDTIVSVIRSFIGKQMQIPPMYSALKVGGKKLYELAREGIEVERKPRPVTIYDINIVETDLPRVRFRVECSKGTYIRTLCHDIGQKAGCGGVMESLIRTRVDVFSLDRARKLSEIEELIAGGRTEEFLMPVDRLFETYPAWTVKNEALKAVMNGNCISVDMFYHEDGVTSAVTERKMKELCFRKNDGRVRVYDDTGRFYGLYEPHSEHADICRPYKMFL